MDSLKSVQAISAIEDRAAVPREQLRSELGEGPAFRFVLVSVLRGRCRWLSVRSGGGERAGTDI